VAQGGTGASDAAGARTNLGLGTIATQNSNAVTITGGSITGITDITVADGGTGVSSTTAYGVLAGGTTSTGPFQNIGTGTSGQVLVSNGASALPTFQTISVQPFAAGTRLLFQQTTAPTGWTKVTTFDQAALRIVSGTASSGGTVNFTSAFASQTPSGSVSVSVSAGTLAVSAGTLAVNSGSLSVGSTTLTTAQMPSHTHTAGSDFGAASQGKGATIVRQIDASGNATSSTGGGGSHTHSISGSPQLSGSPALSGSPSVTSASFSGSAINLAVKYVDAIIASKD
jgi:hypothetical protein